MSLKDWLYSIISFSITLYEIIITNVLKISSFIGAARQKKTFSKHSCEYEETNKVNVRNLPISCEHRTSNGHNVNSRFRNINDDVVFRLFKPVTSSTPNTGDVKQEVKQPVPLGRNVMLPSNDIVRRGLFGDRYEPKMSERLSAFPMFKLNEENRYYSKIKGRRNLRI